MTECIIVGIGGFIGAVCRYLIGLIPVSESCPFPIKTFLINITGCFTTFSSFALETENLLKSGNVKTAIVYAVLSMAVGTAAVFAGEAIAK